MRSTPRLVAWATSRPRRALALVALLTAAAVPGLARLELATDGRALVPASAPEVAHDHSIRGLFDVRDPLVVVLRLPDGVSPADVFEPSILAVVDELTTELVALPEIGPEHAQSLATEAGLEPLPGTFRFRTLLDPLPTTNDAASALRRDLEAIRLYDGVLVSFDRRSAAVVVGVPALDRGAVDRWRLLRRVRTVVEAVQARAEEPARSALDVSIVGAPAAEARLGRQVLHDLGLTPWRGANELGEPSLGVGMVPLALVVMLVILRLAFGRLATALLPLATVGLCLAMVFGLMGWLGVPVYLTSTVLPVILTAVGVADEVHVLHCLRRLRRLSLGGSDAPNSLDSVALVRTTLAEMTPPVVKTSLTTGLAFLSFGLSPLPPVRVFGLFAALGILLCLGLSLVFVPACLVLRSIDTWVPAGAAHRPPRQWWQALGETIDRRRRPLLAAMLGLVAAAGLAAHQVEVQDSWIDAFPPSSDFARAMHRFDDDFLGAHQLLVSVTYDAPSIDLEIRGRAVGDSALRLLLTESPALEKALGKEALADAAILQDAWVELKSPRMERRWSSWIESVHRDGDDLVLTLPRRTGSPRFWLRTRDDDRLALRLDVRPLHSPGVLNRLKTFEDQLRRQTGVGGVLGPATYLETTAFMLHPERPGSRRLPERADQARTLWSHFGRVRGAERLAQTIGTERFERALVTVFLERSNYRDTARVIAAVEDSATTLEGGGHRPRLGLAGDVALSQVLIDGVVDSQLRSLGISLLGILIAASWLGGSWRWGVACVAAPAWSVSMVFALMGVSGLPLGVATSMFAAMGLGVGVDFAIHLLEQLQTVPRRGLGDALRTVGPALSIDALTVGTGFSVLVLSDVPANARLGLLLCLAVLACLIATLTLVPSLWALLHHPRRRPTNSS
ncbi:MAG: MMPL family transporter [Acidobacteriota bacterium]